MPAEICIAGAATVASIGTSIYSSTTNNKVSVYDGWLMRLVNFYYYYLPEEYMPTIDGLLMDSRYGDVSNRILLSNGRTVPGIGKHTYYLNGKKTNIFKRRSLWLEKVSLTESNKDIVRYRIKYFFMKTISLISVFIKIIEELQRFNTVFSGIRVVNVISIDTSSDTPKLIQLSKIFHTPKPNQISARSYIMEKWNQQNSFNLKIMLSGLRGLGKTYLGIILKRFIDENYNKNVRLFDDFNPCSVGVNIKTFALATACEQAPVIIVINEIDTIFEKVANPVETHDARLQHARNRSEFHNMMDTIALVPFVICIYTTEKSPTELYRKPEYKSLMRKGRIDGFIQMNHDTSIYTENNYIEN